MEENKRISQDFKKYTNLLTLYELLIFSSILAFFILIFLTHPPAMICDIQQTQTWVLIYTIIYSILSFFPLFIYNFINRKTMKIRNLYNLIRMGTIVVSIVSFIVYTARSGCRVYLNLIDYMFLTVIFTILPTVPILYQILVKIQNKISEKSNKKE